MKNLALKKIGKNAPPNKVLKHIQALQQNGQFVESLPYCERLAAQGHQNADLFHFHGAALHAAENYHSAVVKFNAAVELYPNNATFVNSLGVAFLALDDTDIAVELFKRATQLDDKFYTAWINLGTSLRKLERYQAAELAFTCAHHLDRTNLEPLSNIVDLLIELRTYKKAEEALENLIKSYGKPEPTLILKRLAIATRREDFEFINKQFEDIDRSIFSQNQLAELDNIQSFKFEIAGNYQKAIEILEPWVEVDTPHWEFILTSLGLCYAHIENLDKAIEIHRTILAKSPQSIAGRYNLAHLLFKAGEIEEGNRHYEARWEWREFSSKRRNFDVPRWTGEPLAGKNIMVWREQGIGDEIRYASLLPELVEMGGAVTFESTPKLVELFTDTFPAITVRQEGPQECRGDKEYEQFDYQIPIGALPVVFRDHVDTFKQKQVPWINRYPQAEEKVRNQIGISESEILVGICWRSSNQAASRNRYFFETEQLAPLADLPNVKWVNVQYDATPKEIDQVRELGIDMLHYTDVDQKDDLVGASSILGACDLVITVGGAVGDMTGGLGIPTAYITRKNSEVFLGTDHVPWFPHAKSFPMVADTGDEVMSRIIKSWPELVDWASGINQDRHARTDQGVSGETKLDLQFP